MGGGDKRHNIVLGYGLWELLGGVGATFESMSVTATFSAALQGRQVWSYSNGGDSKH